MQPEYEWDEAKRERNLKKHGVDFRDVLHFHWDSALVDEDCSESYGEPRYRALGFIRDRLMMLVFTTRDECVRVISLRKADRKEVKSYGNG